MNTLIYRRTRLLDGKIFATAEQVKRADRGCEIFVAKYESTRGLNCAGDAKFLRKMPSPSYERYNRVPLACDYDEIERIAVAGRISISLNAGRPTNGLVPDGRRLVRVAKCKVDPGLSTVYIPACHLIAASFGLTAATTAILFQVHANDEPAPRRLVYWYLLPGGRDRVLIYRSSRHVVCRRCHIVC